ncbi:hypothetical protein [Chryseobacterium scophthalmum]|uniref:hypothetical protein n=1 Tax=Chryseobacterium scophthalmum TaxID=59733 RepID=UPI001AEC154F|nr:hypothetical protein [Chryseobacterium scophthalmum]
MNFKQAQQKIRLYRKINSHSHSFRQKDYDNYYEIYPFEDLESVQDILSEYENIKVLNVIKLEDEPIILYAANYYDKYLVEKVENGFKLHFEFNDLCFMS